MKKAMKPGQRYFVINIDEPYAQEIFEVLKRGQLAKGDPQKHWPEGAGISFRQWVALTWPE